MKEIPVSKKIIRAIYDPRAYREGEKIKKPREGFSKETQEKAIENYETCNKCRRPLKSSIVHHHKDFNRSNNTLGNDMPLHTSCHSKLHSREQNVLVKKGYGWSYKKPNEKPLFPILNPPFYGVKKKKIK